MTERFKVEFLQEVFEFLDRIDKKAKNKTKPLTMVINNNSRWLLLFIAEPLVVN